MMLVILSEMIVLEWALSVKSKRKNEPLKIKYCLQCCHFLPTRVASKLSCFFKITNAISTGSTRMPSNRNSTARFV